ncbi:MAG: efflux transporter outer membrane subunit [Terracidiphilus sp.]|jgi:multidrug efflux system outer membrane protein
MPSSSFIRRFSRPFSSGPSIRGAQTEAVIVTLAIGALLLGGCAGAHYRRPDVPVPPSYREETIDSAAVSGSKASLGELQWQDLIRDEELSKLIQEALAHNFDVQIAAARVLQARAQLTVTRSALFPLVNAQGSYSNSRFLALDTSETSMSVNAGWQLDLWGQIRNMTASARAQLLASEQARRVVLQTLVGDVASNYFLLQDFDQELEITGQALKLREDSLALVQLRLDNGYSSELDLRQAEVLVESARTALTGLELQIVQTEDQLDILLGRNPGPVVRSLLSSEKQRLRALPAGLPSTLLDRRPDILQAEQQLIASHALVAVARAAYFPTISLTSSSGFESSALHNLVSSLSGTWAVGPAVSMPIFNAGSIRAGVLSANAQQQQSEILYRKTVQEAFREVADSLVADRKLAELQSQQASLTKSLRQAVELADLRYRGGFSSYLDYLDSERQLLDAQILLVQIRREEMTNTITLYLALGGGWQ